MDEPPPFRIVFDERTGILHLTLRGFWTAETLARFAEDLQAKAAQARVRDERFAILSDASDFPVQSPEIAKGFERITAGTAGAHRGPTAIVVPSALGRMQAQRVLATPQVRIFADLPAARAWLATRRDD